MRMWRNWQTRWFQVPVKRFVWVQIPSSAPCPKSLENSGFSGFSFAFRNHFFVGRRIVENVDFCIILAFQVNASAFDIIILCNALKKSRFYDIMVSKSATTHREVYLNPRFLLNLNKITH